MMMLFVTGCRAITSTVGLAGLGLAILVGVAEAQEQRQRLQQELQQDLQEEEVREPDPARGETLFRKCRQCHAIVSGEVKIGPSLAGVVGRQPGSIPDFGYSQDMIDYGRTGQIWDEQSLDRFLTRPRVMISGTKMVFSGFRKPEDRADLIAYLSAIRG